MAAPTEDHGVAACWKQQRLPANLAARITPEQTDPYLGVARHPPESKMKVGTALPGVAVAAVDLAHEQSTVRKLNLRYGTDGGAARHVRAGMPRSHSQSRMALRPERHKKVKP